MPGLLHVGHHIFLAALAVFDPQVIAPIVVGEPGLRVGGRGRSPIVGRELPGYIRRIGNLAIATRFVMSFSRLVMETRPPRFGRQGP